MRSDSRRRQWVNLWSRTGKAVKTLNAQQRSVTSISWSPDGQTLATGGDDGSIKLWPTEDLDALLVKGCRWASSYLIGTPAKLLKLPICHTPARLRAAAPNLVTDSEAQARPGDLEGAIQGFKTVQQWDPSLVFDPVTHATANQRQGEADLLLQDKHHDRALTKLNEAIALQPDLAIPANTWNKICWYGSLNGQATLVLPACHKAVTLLPNDGNIRDSRGLARALTGDKPGAIQDFQFFVSHTGDAKGKARRQGWLKDLQAGKPPSAIFTPKVLEQLRNE
jgi:tetratricopeptide (TPR) repeat protein